MKKTEKTKRPPAAAANKGAKNTPKTEASKRKNTAKPDDNLNLTEIKQLIELISDKQFNEFELERGGFKLRLMKGVGRIPVSRVAPERLELVEDQIASTPVLTPAIPPQATTPAAAAPAAQEETLHIVTSPIVGTFYRSPSPTAAPFVNIGDSVDEGKVLCIIEAMKLMNEIPSDATGKIEKIFVENGQPVEFGQALFGIKK